MADYRISASMLKKWAECPFQIFCKISNQAKDHTDNSWGDAGTVVHTVIEYYYNHLHEVPLNLAYIELRHVFDGLWDSVETKDLDIETYWLCVINGVKRDVKYTELEYKFEFLDPVNFLGYADVMDRETHTIGDWKTSTYKSKKVKTYEEQLKIYAWAYWKKFGIIPDAWVLFNKIDRLIPFKYNINEMNAVEQLMIDTKKEIDRGLESTDLRTQEKIFTRCPNRQNCFFCPYKTVCSTDLLRVPQYDGEIQIEFSLKDDKLMISGAIPEEIHRLIEQHINYEVKNAFFIIKAMAAKGVRYDGIKRLYKRKDYGAIVSIGYMQFCHKTLKNYANSQNKNLKLILKDFRDQEIANLKTEMPEKLFIDFEPFEWQKECIDVMMKYRWAGAEVGTGGGKTYVAAELIRKCAVKSLFIIDNKDLLMQTKDEYEKMLGIKCGVVGMGKREWDYPVVLATIQTLNKNVKEFKSELLNFALCIFDEYHQTGAKSYEIVSKYLKNTKYRFSFSATAKRDDGDTNIIFAVGGEVVYRKKAHALIEEGILMNPDIVFYKYDSPKEIAENWQTEYVTAIVKNEARNAIIKELADKYAADGKQVMILIKDIKNGHLDWLKTHIINSEVIYGKTEDDIRYETLERFKKREFRVLIGNIKIFNKGLNIKCLEVIINAAGNAGDVVTVQTIGRELRKEKDKTGALYIDFIDKGEYCFKHSISRINALKAEKYDVETAEWKSEIDTQIKS